MTNETLKNMVNVLRIEKGKLTYPEVESFEGDLILFEHEGTKITDPELDETFSHIVPIGYYAESIIKEFTNLNIN